MIVSDITAEREPGGWRDGSAVKGSSCSCRGLEINSQHPHDGCQQSITPVAEDLTPSSGL